MAQFDTNKQTLNRNNNVLYEVQMQADRYGNIITPQATSVSAFGEPISVPVTPVLQLDALYGLDPQLFETYTGAFFDADPVGTATSTGTLMQVGSGTSLGGYGVLRSKRAVRYRPGQGAQARFTAMFTGPVALYTQRAGFFIQEQAIQIGYNGENFGVMRANGGKAHIHKITVTGAGGGTENVDVQLNGTTETIVMTGATTQLNAASLADGIATAFPNWVVEQYDNDIYVLSTTLGPNAGAFSVVRNGAGTSTFADVVAQTGVAQTENWTYQSQFVHDTLDGNGPSGMVIDPTKLNVYQINFRWLGAGQIQYAVEDDEGNMIIFHHEHYANENNTVHIDNPSFKIGYVAYSLGGTGTNVTVSGASMMGAIEGLIQTTKPPTAAFFSTTTNLTNLQWHHVLTSHNKLIHRDKINTRELLLKNVTTSFSGTGAVQVALVLDEDFAGRAFSTLSEWSSASKSTTIVNNVTLPGRVAYIFGVEAGGSSSLDLEELRLAIPPNTDISVLVRSSQQITRTDVSLSWVED